MKKITIESKYDFRVTIKDAMYLLDQVGQITDFNDLSKGDHQEANSIHSFLFSAFDCGVTSDDWINAGVPEGEMEQARLFFQWFARLHVAGIIDHDGRTICADCLPEDQWAFALPLRGTDDERFKVIARGTGESFFCEECKQVIKNRMD